MGREVFHGDPKGTPAQMEAYDKGVHLLGAFLDQSEDSLMHLCCNALGVRSFLIDPMCSKFTPRIVWVMSNFFLCVCMTATAIICTWSLHAYHGSIQDAIITPGGKVKTVAIILFFVLGFPLAIPYSVPFVIKAQLAANEGGGQGLCTGVLNISIVIPQVVIALGAGPWDAIFNKGNLLAFALASAFAFVVVFSASSASHGSPRPTSRLPVWASCTDDAWKLLWP